ncbi:hypothetical protein [Methylobacterium iners]|uniref:Uncharacterized protein n=1 Tax=Methylobacterium iners TaxID=418707 RepID=A0ABQ4S4C7_9HYPH|nr:hypothetical protein [Methylobacterium iners]GJD96612.1 hypothetical protein OCOJLMKI_3835 [Methylobacterium iners]
MTNIAAPHLNRRLTGMLRRLVFGRVPKLFDTAYYLKTHPDAAASWLDPYLHYILVGGRRGYDPNDNFDTAFYRTQIKTRGNPLRHYIEIGAAMGLDPHPQFSTFSYLGRYPDVAANKANPLQHYREHGRPERRIADQSTLLPRAIVALAGIPSAHHWMLPAQGVHQFSLALLRSPPNGSTAEPILRLRVSISLDFDAVDGVAEVITRFSTGVQDTVVLTLNADPVRGGGVPSLILALDHCYVYPIADDGKRIVRYTQAVVWDVRPSTPRVMSTLPNGTLRI